METLKNHVCRYYELLFEAGRRHHLPVETGRSLALALDYPGELLHFVPEGYWDHFHPCDNPLPFLQTRTGDFVLNLGCGVGLDSFALALQGRSQVRIISLDVVFVALKKAALLSSSSGLQESLLSWICGDAEELPFQEERFDWVLMNGVFNLFSKKDLLLEEIRRIMKPSGSLVIADLCCENPLPDYFSDNEDAWAWCMSGAFTEEAVPALLEKVGFDVEMNLRREEKDMFYRMIFLARKHREYQTTEPPR
jgi:SAM-dependent methyltransferase